MKYILLPYLEQIGLKHSIRGTQYWSIIEFENRKTYIRLKPENAQVVFLPYSTDYFLVRERLEDIKTDLIIAFNLELQNSVL